MYFGHYQQSWEWKSKMREPLLSYSVLRYLLMNSSHFGTLLSLWKLGKLRYIGILIFNGRLKEFLLLRQEIRIWVSGWPALYISKNRTQLDNWFMIWSNVPPGHLKPIYNFCNYVKNTNHRLTYRKGAHSFRYFLQPMSTPNLLMHIFILSNPFVVCSCIMHFSWELQLATQCVYFWCTHWVPNWIFQAKCIYAWASNKRICIGEVPKWVYAFWVCKPVKLYLYFYSHRLTPRHGISHESPHL